MGFWNLSEEDGAESFWSSWEGTEKGGAFIDRVEALRPAGGLEHHSGAGNEDFHDSESHALLACLTTALLEDAWRWRDENTYADL